MSKKCSKCGKKSILIISGLFPDALCIDHAPKLSNGSPGYKKRTTINLRPELLGARENDVSFPTSVPLDRCYVCQKIITNSHEFTHQWIKNPISFSYDKFTLPAIPVLELEYYICDNGFGCSIDEYELE
jgi:hypothetical protein